MGLQPGWSLPLSGEPGVPHGGLVLPQSFLFKAFLTREHPTLTAGMTPPQMDFAFAALCPAGPLLRPGRTTAFPGSSLFTLGGI